MTLRPGDTVTYTGVGTLVVTRATGELHRHQGLGVFVADRS